MVHRPPPAQIGRQADARGRRQEHVPPPTTTEYRHPSGARAMSTTTAPAAALWDGRASSPRRSCARGVSPPWRHRRPSRAWLRRISAAGVAVAVLAGGVAGCAGPSAAPAQRVAPPLLYVANGVD